MVVLAQPRQLEMVARRVKVLNSDLDRLNELKSGRKDTSSLGFGLSSSINPQNTPSTNEATNKDGNDNEAKVNTFGDMKKSRRMFDRFYRLTNCLQLLKKWIHF